MTIGNKETVLKDCVQLIGSMGDDLSVVNAARVSMAKESEAFSEKDKKLIKYLAKYQHWTPFSQNAVTFRIKMPIFIARQYFKHTVGFTRNEVSRRYVSDTPEFWEPDEWRAKADNVKQGSSEEVVDIPFFPHGEYMTQALDYYEGLLDEGICPEQARMILPQSMMTEFIETGNLASYARLCKLRLDPHAQKEVQWYAEAISNELEKLFPVSWEALMNQKEDN